MSGSCKKFGARGAAGAAISSAKVTGEAADLEGGFAPGDESSGRTRRTADGAGGSTSSTLERLVAARHEAYINMPVDLGERKQFYMDVTTWTKAVVFMMILVGVLMCSCEHTMLAGIVTIVIPVLGYVLFSELRRRAANAVYLQLLCVILACLALVDFVIVCSSFHGLGQQRKRAWGPTAGVLAACLSTLCIILLCIICGKSVRHEKNADVAVSEP